MRLARLLPVALCSTVALAGCGGSNLLDGSSAEDLQASIVRVQTAVDDGRCSQALTAATEGLRRVDDLPSSVDRKLAARLRQGFEELEQTIPSDCAPRETTTTEPPPVTTTETTPEPEPPPVTTTEEQPPPATTTEQTPPPTDPTDPPTDDQVPLGDDGSGGTPPAEGDPADPALPRGLRELEDAGREMREQVRGAGREARKRLQDALRDADRAFRGRG